MTSIVILYYMFSPLEQSIVIYLYKSSSIVIYSLCSHLLLSTKSSIIIYMEVPQRGGTPKSSILIGLSITETIQLLGYPHLWKPLNGTLYLYKSFFDTSSCPIQSLVILYNNLKSSIIIIYNSRLS